MTLFPEFVRSRKDRPDPNATVLGAAEMDDAMPTDAQYSALWGPWKGREVELYRRSFEPVRALPRADVKRILGQDGEIERAAGHSRRALLRAAVKPPAESAQANARPIRRSPGDAGDGWCPSCRCPSCAVLRAR